MVVCLASRPVAAWQGSQHVCFAAHLSLLSNLDLLDGHDLTGLRGAAAAAAKLWQQSEAPQSIEHQYVRGGIAFSEYLGAWAAG